MNNEVISGMELADHRWIAHVLVERVGHVLLLRRRAGRYLGGQWDIPGGTVEPGESVAQAATREAWEESGLHVRTGDEISHYTNADTEERPISFHTVTFLGIEERGEAQSLDSPQVCPRPEEHDEYRWVRLPDALALDLVWHVRRTLTSRSAVTK